MSRAAPRLTVRSNDEFVHHCAVPNSQSQSYIVCVIVPSSMEQYHRNDDLAGREPQLSQDKELGSKWQNEDNMSASNLWISRSIQAKKGN